MGLEIDSRLITVVEHKFFDSPMQSLDKRKKCISQMLLSAMNAD
jgi:hypothetical protein